MVRLAPGQVIAQVPPMIPAPRVNVVPVPPPAPHILAPRPPPVVVPAGKMNLPPVSGSKTRYSGRGTTGINRLFVSTEMLRGNLK